MNLAELVSIQQKFDEEHGWATVTVNPASAVSATSDDLVGLVGEIGEFANVIKKLKISADRNPQNLPADAAAARPFLSEELVDAFIYLMRIAVHWNIDIESEYFTKLESNRIRFAELKIG